MAAATRIATDVDLRVGRVILRGDVSAIERARSNLPATIVRTCWPATGEDEILLLRRLEVWGDVAELPARTAVAAGELARHAADPWSPSADDAAAVRFRNRLDYRVCLIRDLLAGTAARRWLWHHRASLLALPTPVALAELLGEDALSLPALLERPALAAMLPGLWRALDAPAAREVLRAIAAATGWGSAIAIALDPDPGRAKPLPDGDIPGDLHAARLHHAPAAIAARLPPGLPVDLPPTEARVVLQSVLALWANSPGVLSRDIGGPLLRDFAQRLIRARADITTRLAEPKEGQGAAPVPVSSAPYPAAAGSMPVGPDAAPSDADQAQAVLHQIHGAAKRTATEYPSSGKTADASRGLLPPDGSAIQTISSSTALEVPLPPAADHDFHTRGGGFFFLLNVLNLPALRDWRATLDEPQAGWRELLRLALRLEFLPDPPLAAFLAEACTFGSDDDPVAALARRPAGTDPAVVQRVALRHCGEATLRAALAERPAYVIATRSHVDVHLRLADANLDLRRTGLDLDPGWLPWLGRVVRFHYDSGGLTP